MSLPDEIFLRVVLRKEFDDKYLVKCTKEI